MNYQQLKTTSEIRNNITLPHRYPNLQVGEKVILGVATARSETAKFVLFEVILAER